MAKPKRVSKRIVWAIDPFEASGQTQSHVVAILQKLSSEGAIVEPVYVLSPDEYEMNVEFNAPWLKQIRPSVQKVLEHYLKEVKVADLCPAQIIVERKPSVTRAVWALIAYAKRAKADMILVGTHARKGIQRFFLGSFAETLLLHSDLPVLVVGPHADSRRIAAETSRILFATDFASASLPTFKRVLALAKSRGSKVTLFYSLPHVTEAVFQSGICLAGGVPILFPDFLTKDEQSKRKIAERYVQMGHKLGIEIEIRFNSSHINTAQGIVEHAESEHMDLIAMAAQSGVVSTSLLGSTSRQVVRSAPCPVWVLRA